ncbi:hypothetical protein B0T24DRAFT_224978 [Lasiosphaeria ovina]|uniref:Uncharacterized protein n=1 Tax=Lasiosphaeria ovina TaxID=92902 RepID=A0AAE0KI89_9PEZI|nr:hypothetical protein B0T24DRAFT_224978 [Lasiosphaeria ovina]
MSSVSLDQILCARAGWRLRYLIPCWIFVISVLLCLMGIFAYRLAETLEHYNDNKEQGQAPVVELLWEGTNVGFNLVSLVLNIIEVSRMVTDSLTPFFMLFSQGIKLALALAILGLDVTVYVQRTDANYSIIALALDCGLLVATLGTFVYAFMTYRRLLKYDDYQVTADSKQPEHGEAGFELGYNAGSSQPGAAAYRDLGPGGTEYPSFSKSAIDGAMGAEFGWGSTRGGVAPSEIVIASGVVHSKKAEPVNDGDLRRMRSYATERGVVGAHGELDGDEGDDLETVHFDHDGARQGSIPTVVVHYEDDTQALLADRGVATGTRQQ